MPTKLNRAQANGTSARSEGEYSFGAEQISVDKTQVAENQGIDDKLLHSLWRCFARDCIVKE